MLYTKEKRDEVIEAYNENLASLKDTSNTLLHPDVEELAKDPKKLSDWITNTVSAAVESILPDGTPLPELAIRTTVSDLPSQGYAMISVNISPRKASLIAFPKHTKRFQDTTTSAQDIIDFVADAYQNIFVILMQAHNISKLNEVLDWATKPDQADRRYSIRFVPSALRERKGAFVNLITDEELELVADYDATFNLDDWVILAEPDEFITEEKIEASRKNLVNALVANDRTVDVLASKIQLIRTLAGVGTHRPHVLIRKAYARDAANMSPNIKKTVRARVEVDGVIGAVEYSGNEVSQVLAPVDEKTLEPSDLDIVALAKSYIGA